MLSCLKYCAILLLGQMGRPGLGPIEITARIALEDGSPVNSSPQISLRVPGSEAVCAKEEFFLGGTLRLSFQPAMIRGSLQQGCDISVDLQGYRKFTGYVRDGTLITLKRTGPNEGSSVSSISLNAPANARKAYELGEIAAGKKKWASAEEHFREAVTQYPQYSLAWSELGQVLQNQGQFDVAVKAFHEAHAVDPLYIKPIVQLAAASAAQQQWSNEMKFSEEALLLHPVEFPAAYFYHAEATYHLGSLDDAERLTREAIQLDPGGSGLESLYLLACIFEKQGQREYATIQYQNYLKSAPHGSEAARAKEALVRLKQAR